MGGAMSTIARPPTAQTAPRLILLEERDLEYPLDSEGTPTSSGKLWMIPVTAVTAVEVEPENTRGIVVRIHVRGRRVPIVPCDCEAALAALGARIGTAFGHLVWAGSDGELDEEAAQ